MQLGKHIILEQFNTEEEKSIRIGELSNNDIIYDGKISDITEKIAIKCVKHDYLANGYYIPDFPEKGLPDIYKTAKKLLLIACVKPFCLIYKNKI